MKAVVHATVTVPVITEIEVPEGYHFTDERMDMIVDGISETQIIRAVLDGDDTREISFITNEDGDIIFSN